MTDFIIAGSGSSGGILAKNLHESGSSVLLLEAGKYFKKDTFPKTEAAYSSQLFWGGGLEFDEKARTAFLRAKCVGGTTIVNQCLMNRFDDIALDDWKNRSGVDYLSVAGLEPHYEKVESIMQLHYFERKEFNRNAELFTSGCDKNGYKWKFLRRGQSDCKTLEGNDCIGCLGGCHRDSKQSTLVTAIQNTEQKGLKVVSEFEVKTIEHHKDHVVVRGLQNKETRELKARRLILAGGSFGTTKILLNSGIKDKLPALGKGFCQHPQYMAFGLFDDPVDSHKGAFQTVASDDMNFRKNGYKLENVYAPPISVGMLINTFGPAHQRIMLNYRNMACIEVAIRDEPEGGEMKVDKKGNLIVTKNPTDQDKARVEKGIETLVSVFAAAGAKEVVRSPFSFGLHLMGGCIIGVDPQKSVVNPNFQVHGHENIYIADSSIFPSAPGINPSLTIMALSQKLSEELCQGNL